MGLFRPFWPISCFSHGTGRVISAQQIALSGVDTVAFGWNDGTRSGSIEVVPALPGYMIPN